MAARRKGLVPHSLRDGRRQREGAARAQGGHFLDSFVEQDVFRIDGRWRISHWPRYIHGRNRPGSRRADRRAASRSRASSASSPPSPGRSRAKTSVSPTTTALSSRKIIGEMAERVAGGLHTCAPPSPRLTTSPSPTARSSGGRRRGSLRAPTTRAFGKARLQLGHGADVIVMVVGEPDVGQTPAFFVRAPPESARPPARRALRWPPRRRHGRGGRNCRSRQRNW